MANKNREGWADDRSADDRPQWRSGSGPVSSGGGHGAETVPFGPGGVSRGTPEGVGTQLPPSIKQLYGILVVLDGPRRFDIHKMDQRKVTIGRDRVDIRLDDAAVGAQHAVITVDGNDATDAEFRILDRGLDGLGTKAGTRVNGRYVSEAALKDRDRIQFGETQLLFVQLWPETL